MTGNPVECVIHPDLWNKSELWDPLGIGRVSLDPVTERNLDDEYVEENYGSPINTVRELCVGITLRKPFSVVIKTLLKRLMVNNESRKYFPRLVVRLMKPQHQPHFFAYSLVFRHFIASHLHSISSSQTIR